MLWEQVLATSPLEWLAVLMAIAYVWLAARQNIACWPCAFTSTAIYTYLFWQVALPFQSLLNAYYMFMAVYGFWQWRHGLGSDNDDSTIRKMAPIWHLFFIPCALLIAWILVQFVASQFSSDFLYLDAFIQVSSMMTTYLVTKKYLENWLYWVVINMLSAWLYWQSGLLVTGILFGAYVGFAIYGYVQWQQSRFEANSARLSTQTE